jgi:hypothetical protein
MLMSTISKMSARSNIFQFTDLPNTVEDATIVDANFGLANRERAQYEIIAAISQMDENVSARSRGFSIRFPSLDLSAAEDINVTVISVDFLISKPSSGLVLNGINASNAIAIARTGKAGDIGGQIQKSGFFFNISLDQSEGTYAAIRALVELSTIEILGKLAEVPYWQCLQIDQTNPEVMTVTYQWYQKMSQQQRVTFVQKMLARNGLYTGKSTGDLDALTSSAITRYQQAYGLIPSGRVDLDLYRSLTGNDVGDRMRLAKQQPATQDQPTPAAATELEIKPTLTLTTDRGPQPQYNAQEKLTVIAAVSQPAYLYCFYQDAGRQIVKLYPNRFQPAPLVKPGAPVTIPGTSEFSLLLEQSGSREEVVCMASPHPLDTMLPEPFAYDLEPIAADSMEAIVKVFAAANPNTLAQQRLTISVR